MFRKPTFIQCDGPRFVAKKKVIESCKKSYPFV